jgi:hypothetical protein
MQWKWKKNRAEKKQKRKEDLIQAITTASYDILACWSLWDRLCASGCLADLTQHAWLIDRGLSEIKRMREREREKKQKD